MSEGPERSHDHSMKPVTVISALLLVFVVTWFVYDYYSRRTSCDAVFEQSAPSLKANLGFIDAKGEVTIGRQQVQVLGESSQKLALTLRNCCIAHRSGRIRDSDYRACIGGAKNYEARVRDVKNDIERSQAAAGERDADRAAQYATRAKRVVEVAIGAVEARRRFLRHRRRLRRRRPTSAHRRLPRRRPYRRSRARSRRWTRRWVAGRARRRIRMRRQVGRESSPTRGMARPATQVATRDHLDLRQRSGGRSRADRSSS